MKIWNVERYDLQKIQITSEDNASGRTYKLTDGTLLPSVTTVLSKALDKSFLDEWRERVGAEHADKIVRQASIRGSAIHDLLERFVLGDDVDTKRMMPSTKRAFLDVVGVLKTGLTAVYGTEVPLYSKRLNAAGRSDLLGRWEDVPAIIDYKNIRSSRSEEAFNGYFLQTTAYAMMASRMYGVAFKRIVIIASCVDDFPLTFVRNTCDYVDQVVSCFDSYRNLTENEDGGDHPKGVQ